MNQETTHVYQWNFTAKLNRFGCDRNSMYSISFTGLNIVSLTGVHKEFDQIKGVFFCRQYATHILGLLLIKGIKKIHIDNDGPIDKIMNKYLPTHNVILAQDELIDAGFIEQAKL